MRAAVVEELARSAGVVIELLWVAPIPPAWTSREALRMPIAAIRWANDGLLASAVPREPPGAERRAGREEDIPAWV
jgi:hypothetical protein